jgi:hypothetical protein
MGGLPASKGDFWGDGGKRGETGETGETGEEFYLLRRRVPTFDGTELKIQQQSPLQP